VITRRKLIRTVAAQIMTSSGLVAFMPQARAAPTKGLSYGSNKLDIYPANSASGKAPIVIYVHGGAWRGGSRSSVGSKAKYFSQRGRMFISVDYTLYPRADASTQARQIGQAVSWVRANAAKYGGNPSRIALMGHSAGCHLSALATLTGSASGVRALICNDTRAYDLPYLAKISGGRLPVLYSALESKSKYRAWSPITYANGGPPTLVAWSNGKNRDVLSKRFAKKLGRGASVTLFNGSRYSHGAINSRMGAESGGITAAVDSFLRRHIG
jgi:pimeloyl-ACP methyl ester carboxylesterase